MPTPTNIYGKVHNTDMIPVARTHDVTIHSPEGTMVAFTSSPYPVHIQGGAVDIFGKENFQKPVKSPVTGKVLSVERKRVGKSRYFDSEPYDYIILIRTNGICARVLHCKPEVEKGDFIEKGDILGNFLRSPLLPFWSRPHIHIEIKDPKDPVGPKNSFLLERMGNGEFHGDPEFDFDTIEGKVISSTRNEVIVSPRTKLFGSVGRYSGVAVRIGDEMGILDAHTPWNCYGGVALTQDSKAKLGDEVKLGRVLLGNVERIHRNIATYSFGGAVGNGIRRFSKGLLYMDEERFNAPRKRIDVNGNEFLGFSTGLSLSENRTIRLVPQRPLKENYATGDILNIELDPQSSISV
jgi:hypothetical protein